MTKLGSTWYHITVEFFQWNLYVEGVFFSAPIYIRFSKKWCYLCVKGDYVKICGKNVGLLLHDKWKKKKKKTKIVEFLFFFEEKVGYIFTSRNAPRISRLRCIHNTYYTLDSTGWVYHTYIMASLLFIKPGIYGIIKWRIKL